MGIPPSNCPSCGNPLRDLRAAAFNHGAMSRDGVCFLWSNNDYSCAVEYWKAVSREIERGLIEHQARIMAGGRREEENAEAAALSALNDTTWRH